MNDTHGETGKPWVGFGLDGTLAHYDGWVGIDNIGEPIAPMVARIQRMHNEGTIVKIVTARVMPRTLDGVTVERFMVVDGVTKFAHDFIAEWCQKYLGFVPEIVYQKDPFMVDLYDDRCHQVEPNTGVLIEEAYELANDNAKELTTLNRVLCEKVRSLRDDLDRKEVHIVHRTKVVDVRWTSRLGCVLLGVTLAMAAFMVDIVFFHDKDIPAAEQKLREALSELSEARASSRFEKLLYRLPDRVVDDAPYKTERYIMERGM